MTINTELNRYEAARLKLMFINEFDRLQSHGLKANSTVVLRVISVARTLGFSEADIDQMIAGAFSPADSSARQQLDAVAAKIERYGA